MATIHTERKTTHAAATDEQHTTEEPPSPLTQPTHPHAYQTLLHSKFIAHHPKAGVNPLVDAAAYLFSSIGKLNLLKSYRNLQKLQKELISEMDSFYETAKCQGYSSEAILISRYALCATVDDIISNTTWGNAGQWDDYSVLKTYYQESINQDRFFVILERIIKDPAIYIDVMEFMYICLSLGYKGSYRYTDASHHQLENISHALYKRIRAHHGDYTRNLSPPPVRNPHPIKKTTTTLSYTFTFLMTAIIVMLVFIGLGYLMDTISNQAHEELTRIGKSTLYETTA